MIYLLKYNITKEPSSQSYTYRCELDSQPFADVINDNEVHVWYINTTKINDFALFKILNLDEITYSNTFINNTFKKNYIIARAYLKILLGLYLKQKPTNINIIKSKNSKPFIPSCPIKFNISHSNSIIMLSFIKNYEIGIDIEYIKAMDEIDSIITEITNNKELSFFNYKLKTDKLNTFYNIWTCKESFLKMTGYGLHYPMNKVTIYPSNNITYGTINDELGNYAFYKTILFTNLYACNFCFTFHPIKEN